MRALTRPRSNPNRLQNRFLIAYVIVMFGLGTIFTAMNMHLSQISYIDNRNFPQGPIGYSLAMYTTWRVTVPNACSLIANWLADGLLVLSFSTWYPSVSHFIYQFQMYRVYILYNMSAMVLIAPGIMYLASICTRPFFHLSLNRAQSVLQLWELSFFTSRPARDPAFGRA
jgi:hypothetical protein